MKKKILFYSDSPIATTGLGRLTSLLIPGLAEEYEITQVALNHHDININSEGVKANYDQSKYKWKIISTYMQQDAWGSGLMTKLLSQYKWDIIFTSCDLNRVMPFYQSILNAQKTGAEWILYTPIDRIHVLKQEALVFRQPDKLIVLSDYAKKLLNNRDVEATRIYHPVELSDFTTQKNKSAFVNWERNFIIGNINRHTFRKDLARTMFAFNEYQRYDNMARLYLHTKPDEEAGDLRETMIEMDIEPDKVRIADIQDASSAYPQEKLAKIYSGLDLFVSTSKGEGFGYTVVEAMASKVPILVPDNTSMTEFIGSNRGYLIDCKEWVIDYGHSNCMRYITDTADMVKKIKAIRANYKDAQARAENAYKFVKEEMNPEKIIKEFLNVFQNV